MIDLSDGLSSDLAHICNLSKVGARIFHENLPIDGDLEQLNISKSEKLSMALNGGEDFKLLFTINKKNISGLPSASVTHIGEITANIGIIELIDGDKTSILEPKGYRHF